MTDAVRTYLLSIIAAVFLGTLCGAFFPKGNLKKLMQFVCGLLLVIVLVRPYASLDYSVFSQAIAKAFMQSQQTKSRVAVKNRELVAEIIKQNTEAYILDKAHQNDMQITAEVIMDGFDTYPYPSAVIIIGRFTAAQQAALCSLISRELGIPSDRQEWNTA